MHHGHMAPKRLGGAKYHVAARTFHPLGSTIWMFLTCAIEPLTMTKWGVGRWRKVRLGRLGVAVLILHILCHDIHLVAGLGVRITVVDFGLS